MSPLREAATRFGCGIDLSHGGACNSCAAASACRMPWPASHWRQSRHHRGTFAIMPDARFASLTPLFAPRSVAVLGASSDPTRISGRPIAYMKAQGFQGAHLPGQPEPRRGAGAEGLSLGRRPAGDARRRHRRDRRRTRRAGRSTELAERGVKARGDVHRRLRRDGRGRRGGAGPHGRRRRASTACASSGPTASACSTARTALLRDVLLVVRQRLAGAGAHRHRLAVGRLWHASLHAGAQPRHRRLALHHDRQRGRRDGRRMHRLAGGKPRSRRDRRLCRGHPRGAPA